MIHFSCPNCAQKFDFPDTMAGHKFPCQCGQRVQVPQVATALYADPAKTRLGAVEEEAAPPSPEPRRRERAPDPLIRCERCGELRALSKIVRTTSWTGTTYGSIGDKGLSAHSFGPVDLCEECARSQSSLVTVLVYVFLAALGIGLIAAVALVLVSM